MARDDDLSLDLSETPEASAIIAELERAFHRLGDDEEYKEGLEMVVPGAGKVYGVRVPVLRALSKQISRRYKGDHGALEEISAASWDVHSREHELVALFVLGNVKGLTPSRKWHQGTRFLTQVMNWESCDQLCANLLGPALAEDPIFMRELEGWLDSPNLWVRRGAIVSTVYLRRARFDTNTALELDARTLQMCERLLDDREKYIRKAVDWAIREVIKRNYDLAFAWMMERAQSAPSAAARSTINLAAKKLDDGDRERLKKMLLTG